MSSGRLCGTRLPRSFTGNAASAVGCGTVAGTETAHRYSPSDVSSVCDDFLYRNCEFSIDSLAIFGKVCYIIMLSKICKEHVKGIPKELRSQLKSDFKVIADFFAEKDDKNYTPSNDAIKHPEAVLHMLKVFTNDNRYNDIEESMLLDIQEGKVITMCNFAERMEQKGIQKGRQEGESLLAEAILALKAGRTIEELKDAYNDHTLELAQKCLY